MTGFLKRPWLACGLLALGLRAGLALVTEVKPLFPSYYYEDARLTHAIALDMLKAWKQGTSLHAAYSPSQRVYAFAVSTLYRAAGPRPLAPKLLNAALGAAAVLALFLMLAPIFGAGPALAAAALTALWPSHVFFTSQNFKDAGVILLAYLALASVLRLASSSDPPRPRPAAAWAALGAASLLALGLLRSHLMLLLTALLALAAAAAAAARWRRKEPPWQGVAALILCLASPWLYQRLAHAVFDRSLAAPAASQGDPTVQASLLPKTFIPDENAYVAPFSPRAITQSRRVRQVSDEEYAVKIGRPPIGTQLFVGVEFRTWLDVLAFLPKGMFYVLFMPLPGLYPLGANPGRWLAALENLGLVALALAAAWGFKRGPKTPERLSVLGLFLALAATSALVEFDLGSAARHKTLYLPLLFPFAFSLAPRPREPRRGRRKVMQILECGGPGGTGNQVAGICNGLSRDSFEVGLAYACRGTAPEAYRARVSGAASAWHVPELVREISPLNDAKALLRLYQLFKSEQPDVVHLHSSKAGFLGRLAAWLAGVPRIYYSPHGYGFLQLDRSRCARTLYKLLEWGVSWIGTVVAVSESEATLAQDITRERPVLIARDSYLGPEGLSPKPHDGAVVGGCGRLTPARNPDAFVKLCQRLTDSRNNLRCVWIGGGELELEVRRNLENMNLVSKVEVTGWLEPAQARERLQGLDVFVHYSAWDALPNAVLEAMAAGLPVVASDVGGCRDCVVHGETGFLARTEAELLERCLKLLDDPELRRRLGAAGRERVLSEFSRKRQLSTLASLYAS